MQVTFTNAARKALKKMPATDRERMIEKLKNYAETGEGDVKKLTGSTGEYRLRHGDWRAIFEIEADMIVLKIAHRREAYR